ncbi:MAG: hypothetical protein EOO90_03475 [Pedobacter sp.]|nr:MAG: hypothetical protein EOO90_03475 [Pedobacter sp.]
MEPYDIHITLEGELETLRIQPLEEMREDKHQYQIYKGDELLGTVWPDCLDQGVCWYSSDEFTEDTLIKIGEAIEDHDM